MNIVYCPKGRSTPRTKTLMIKILKFVLNVKEWHLNRNWLKTRSVRTSNAQDRRNASGVSSVQLALCATKRCEVINNSLGTLHVYKSFWTCLLFPESVTWRMGQCWTLLNESSLSAHLLQRCVTKLWSDVLCMNLSGIWSDFKRAETVLRVRFGCWKLVLNTSFSFSFLVDLEVLKASFFLLPLHWDSCSFI